MHEKIKHTFKNLSMHRHMHTHIYIHIHIHTSSAWDALTLNRYVVLGSKSWTVTDSDTEVMEEVSNSELCVRVQMSC